MMNIIVSIILLILIVTFACLQSLWAGMVYFALSFLCVFCIYWAVVLILKYNEEYKKNFEEDFKFYCISLVNSTDLTLDEIYARRDKYVKSYKKYIRRDKLIDIGKILVALSIACACIVAMCTI